MIGLFSNNYNNNGNKVRSISSYRTSLNDADETDYLLPNKTRVSGPTTTSNVSSSSTSSNSPFSRSLRIDSSSKEKSFAKIPPENILHYFLALFVLYSSVIFLQWSYDRWRSKLPNIVFILTDDQGMGDMDNDGMDFDGLMPAIRALNQAGINLTHYYSMSLCTPARSALLTGKYPVSNGMQHGVITGTKPFGLELSETLLPEYLQEAGYSSFLIGKWHLGHYANLFLPTRRGFESFFGYYGGFQHPVTYEYEWPVCLNQSTCQPDMHHNEKPIFSDGVTFNTDLFATEAERLIRRHNRRKPFFLLYSLPLMHMPVVVDETLLETYSDQLSHITNSWRKKTAVMAIMLNNAVERLMVALLEAQVLDNTIVIFASDNGAQAEGTIYGAGSNYPLRGTKGTLFEGGCRVPAFVFSPLLGHVFPTLLSSDPNSVDDTISGRWRRRKLRFSLDEVFSTNQMTFLRSDTQRRLALNSYTVTNIGGQSGAFFHVSDWVPTLLEAVGKSSLIEDMNLDGVSHWKYFQNIAISKEIGLKGDDRDDSEIRGLDDDNGAGNNNDDESVQAWPRTEFLYNFDPVSGIGAYRRLDWKLMLNESDLAGWFDGTNYGVEYCGTSPTGTVLLFNLTADPFETQNVADDFPDIVSELIGSILSYSSSKKSLSFCGAPDPLAIRIWDAEGFIDTWKKSDSVCPVSNWASGWCTLVASSIALPEPSAGQMGLG